MHQLTKLRYGSFVKQVKKKIPWLDHIIENEAVARDLDKALITYKVPDTSLCVICKGTKMLCWRTRCPLLSRVNAYVRTIKNINDVSIFGDSPPSVFVGRIGYPYVYLGPLVPPVEGDTSVFDLPEKWLGKSLQDILSYRYKLVRGMFKGNVKKVNSSSKVFDATRELALSESPVDAEMLLKKKPKHNLIVDSEVQPMGPSAPLKLISIGSVKIPRPVERVYQDTDLKANEAITTLYKHSIPVTRIQRILSVGALGIGHHRKLVPTRWSITAVDTMLSNELKEHVFQFPLINEYLVFEVENLSNRFVILMIPREWNYELIEAWFPGTSWNPSRRNVAMVSDWETTKGRKTYASIGGCYYAARLAVTEYLTRIRRQATVVIFRETLPGDYMPLGVWFVRENVRAALRTKPQKFNTFNDAINDISRRLKIPLKYWFDVSGVLGYYRKQTRLTDYF